MLANFVEGDPKAAFQLLLQRGVREGATPFPGFLQFTLDPHLLMLSAKEGGVKYHFLSLWYDSTWDRTPLSQNRTLYSLDYNGPGLFMSTKIYLSVYLSMNIFIYTRLFISTRIYRGVSLWCNG